MDSLGISILNSSHYKKLFKNSEKFWSFAAVFLWICSGKNRLNLISSLDVFNV
jgi:hypothetical protein